MMPLAVLRIWQPFRIDALGLVTLLGSEEMSRAIGRLVHSSITEWLPLLGAYTVVNEQITQPVPGFVLYNVTDGILATDVSGWFARWLLSHPLTYTATKITLRLDGAPMTAGRRVLALALGVLSTAPLLVLAAVIGDYWGVANAVATVVSVAVRRAIVGQLRGWLDRTAADMAADPGESVKAFLTLPNGKAVTIYGPRRAIVECLLTEPRPSRPRLYGYLQLFGWLAFGVHVITLGMATLFSQLLCVFVLLSSTLLAARHVGDRWYVLGSNLRLDVDVGDSSWSRLPAYIRLDLSPVQEDAMVHWNLFPQRSNTFWWRRYKQGKELAASARCQEKFSSTCVTEAPPMQPA
jgi:hypothetical protein